MSSLEHKGQNRFIWGVKKKKRKREIYVHKALT